MHIVSKIKDYYDSAVGMGIDKSIVYVRHQKQMDLPDDVLEILGVENTLTWLDGLQLRSQSFIGKEEKTKIFTILIGFCGKIYIGYKIYKEVGISEDKYDIKYDTKEVEDLIDFKKSASWNMSEKKCIANFRNFKTDIASIDTMEIFRKYNTPVFAVGHHNSFLDKNQFIVNPILKDYQFARVFDPYTAFQEIQMFVSGVLPSGDNSPETKMTEKQKVNQHGFDEKYGFRTRPKNKK